MKIDYIPLPLAEKFANEFAGDKKGFSAKQISEYFCSYSNLVKHVKTYRITPTRHDLFIESLNCLESRQQYSALNDLTLSKQDSKYPYPDETTRETLRGNLHTIGSPNPIGIRFSKISEKSFRLDWIEASRRISIDPPGAITAARTMVETVLKSIIHERGEEPDNSGDLGRLIRQTEKVLEFSPSEHQGEHQIISGFASVMNGLACLSNNAGDRHGTVGGVGIDDPIIAELCVYACGTIGIFFIGINLFKE